MSVRGIDNQHMIARMSDFMKDSSVQIKKNELTHDYLAVLERQREEQDKTTVIKTSEAQGSEIHPDKEGEGRGYRPGEKKKKKDTESRSAADDILVAPDPSGHRMIDIKI